MVEFSISSLILLCFSFFYLGCQLTILITLLIDKAGGK